MDTELAARVTAHVAHVQQLLTLATNKSKTIHAVQLVNTNGKDESAPTVGRLALIGTAKSPRLAEITAVSPTKVRVSYLTESGIRHGRTLSMLNSHPIHLDSWPDTFREYSRDRWKRMRPEDRGLSQDGYAEYQYRWALKVQAVYRAVKHCPWVALAPIRNTVIRRADLVMVPENGDSK